MKNIEFWREQIDHIEDQLIEIINKRAQCAIEIGSIKRKEGRPILDPKREQEILDRVVAKNPGPLPNEDLRTIFATLIETTRNFEDRHSAEQHTD